MKKTILVVEDEESYQSILSEKLTGEGYNIVCVGNGVEGLQKAILIHPDLILLDIYMPKVDGIQMLKDLRKDEWGKEAKILILTNLDSTKLVQEAFSEQVYDYMVKNENKLEDVTLRIKQLLS